MPLLIDALNVAYWCGAPPGLRLPLAVLSGALAAGHAAELVFDASAPYQWRDDAEVWAQLLAGPWPVTVVPSGRSADAVLLRMARDCGGCIVSNDRFRDYRRRFRRLIDDPLRLQRGAVRNDFIEVPGLGLHWPLPASAPLALAVLAQQQ